MNDTPNQESSIDASPLFFGDIRFVRETLCGKLQDAGAIKGLEDLLDIAVGILETDVAIARAQGKSSIMRGRLSLSSAIDRAEHLNAMKAMI